MVELDNESNFDAERISEDIATGEKQKPRVNVESDYERSKEFAVADIDKAESDAKDPAGEGDPNAFRGMAKQVKPSEE